MAEPASAWFSPPASSGQLHYGLAVILTSKGRALGLRRVGTAVPRPALYELRAADVAFVSKVRWDAVGDDDDMRGAPDLVVEVLSQSNTRPKVAALCLSAGTAEFWVLDPHRKTVTVIGAHAVSVVYGRADSIPLRLFGGELDVAEIFA